MPLSADSCSGSFSYRYIVNHLLTNRFVAKDWQANAAGVYDGTTAFASAWEHKTVDYSLEITNKTSPSVLSIAGKKGLKVTWFTWAGGPSGSCSDLNFTANKHVLINASALIGSCIIK